jgi:excisionase family DNA binding protein
MNEQNAMNTLYSVNFQSAPGQPLAQPPANPAPAGAASPSKPLPLAYTVEEAAAALNVSTKTVRRLLDRGILTASKALRKKLIPQKQLDDFLKSTCDIPKTIR